MTLSDKTNREVLDSLHHIRGEFTLTHRIDLIESLCMAQVECINRNISLLDVPEILFKYMYIEHITDNALILWYSNLCDVKEKDLWYCYAPYIAQAKICLSSAFKEILARNLKLDNLRLRYMRHAKERAKERLGVKLTSKTHDYICRLIKNKEKEVHFLYSKPVVDDVNVVDVYSVYVPVFKISIVVYYDTYLNCIRTVYSDRHVPLRFRGKDKFENKIKKIDGRLNKQKRKRKINNDKVSRKKDKEDINKLIYYKQS
jgi:hypothetical protein